MTAPSVGRIVHYKSYGTPGGEYEPECRAAIIAGVVGLVAELCVLNPRGVFFDTCEHDEDEKRGGTWHWPERVDDDGEHA